MSRAGEASKHRGNLARFQQIHHTSHHRLDLVGVADRTIVRNWVDDNYFGRKPGYFAMYQQQVLLQTTSARTYSVEMQEAPAHPTLEINSDRAHVADDLVRRLFRREVDALLAALACSLQEMRRDAAFSRSCSTRNQNAASADKSFAEHGIQRRDSAGHPLIAGFVVEAQGAQGQDGEPIAYDQERIFARAMQRAAILDHSQATNGVLIVNPMIEKDHTIGDVLLQPLARELAAPGLSRNNGGHLFFLQPAKKA